MPEPKPLTITISKGFFEESFRVQLFSKPQQTQARRTNREPWEKTILLISHRLANVVDSDRIYMMENGRVVQTGTHEELMAMKGAYERLYSCQSRLEAYGKEPGMEAAG